MYTYSTYIHIIRIHSMYTIYTINITVSIPSSGQGDGLVVGLVLLRESNTIHVLFGCGMRTNGKRNLGSGIQVSSDAALRDGWNARIVRMVLIWNPENTLENPEIDGVSPQKASLLSGGPPFSASMLVLVNVLLRITGRTVWNCAEKRSSQYCQHGFKSPSVKCPGFV